MRPRKGQNKEGTMAPVPQGLTSEGQRRTSVWEHTPGRYSQETGDGARLWVSPWATWGVEKTGSQGSIVLTAHSTRTCSKGACGTVCSVGCHQCIHRAGPGQLRFPRQSWCVGCTNKLSGKKQQQSHWAHVEPGSGVGDVRPHVLGNTTFDVTRDFFTFPTFCNL